MTDTDSATASIAGGDTGGPDAIFRLAVSAYSGAVLAWLAATIGALTGRSPVGLGGTYATGFAVGVLVGLAAASVDLRLPSRLGRNWRRRLAIVLPVLPIVVVWLVPLETGVSAVSFWSVIVVFASGYALSQLAGNRYVNAVTPGEPEETWQWEPPGSVVVDLLLAGTWVLLGIGNVATRDPMQGLMSLLLAVGWVAACLVEGRWPFGPGRERCEIQFYETGLVKRRPYTKAFVPWRDVNHVRLREGELVIDRGLRDVRFDRDELEDPEAVLEAIDRRIASAVA
ncbi:hypothetical protein HTZ84_16845 [Haloterrigena sp. SYSU A558-1]|uniref:PH domain-containing protein n=1 Tax=Haloterrigena gelatinilytica TaxID=2741724 RepID=A0ABX2LEY7_9EURY|nr:hypothetical protein [Haloterrigena gelatinilytica]NUC73948.1 hypothetical protein [Haloterrigena gelatinilytica]